MPLTEAGVKFVAEGYNDFIRKMGSASESIVETADAIVNLGKMTDNKLAAMGKLNDALAIIGNTTDNISNDMVRFAKSSSTSTDNTNEQTKALESLGRQASKSGSLLGSLGKIITGAFAGAKVGGFLGVLIPTIGEEIPLAIIGAVVGGLTVALHEIEKSVDAFWQSVAAKLSSVGNVVAKIAGAGMKIVSALYEMGKKVVSVAGGVLKSILNAMTFGALGTGSFRSLGDSVFGAMLKFELLKQVVRKVIQEFKDYTKVAYEAAEILQTLTVRLDNLIARQMRNAGLMDNYADSMSEASGYTQELLGWISELSIATPFGVDIVSETVSLSMAMGWSIDATKEMTTAILNYSAAQGLSNDVMERIIYNFAQMRQAGKVTGTELRDLARGAFMPVNDVLEEAARMLDISADNMQEFREAAASGAIDVETFFQAFINLSNREFPNAARNMNFTMAAVIDNVKDVFRVFLG
jgi:tape measure domain-containing protein